MRVNLNLNQYYEGLDDYQVNTLFGLFINLKPSIEMFKDATEEGDKEIADDEKYTAFSGFSSIDSFMESMRKKAIFDTKRISEEYKTDEAFFDEFDITPLIDKYDFLMSKPEKEKTTDENASKNNDIKKKPSFGEGPGSDGLR